MNIQSGIDAGLFVEFVANGWNTVSQITNLNALPVLNPAGTPVIPGKTYTVLRTIYACDLATDLVPDRAIREGWKTMGIVAVNDADPNDVVIAIRGTLTVWEWLQDAKFLYKPFTKVPSAPLTEDGFTDMYLSFSLNPAAPAMEFVASVVAILPAAARITVAGHSLGSALATLLALDFSVHTTMPVTLYTLASPRVGDLSFSQLFNHAVPNAYRIANRMDVVPKVPAPLFFFHVGDETELVPGPTLKFDLGCEHHLTSYFNMLAGLISPAAQAAYPIQAGCTKGAAAAVPAIAGP